jgi:hypothetical protein
LLKKKIKCNIWRVAVCPSYLQDAQFLKVKHRVKSHLPSVALLGAHHIFYVGRIRVKVGSFCMELACRLYNTVGRLNLLFSATD